MLIVTLIATVAFTAWCIWAEAHPPPSKPEVKVPDRATQVIVQMIEEGPPDDDDPPTVVQIRRG